MNREIAEKISKKTRALKHCDKILTEVDKKGKKTILLNNTGVEFTVTKGDAIYLRIQSTKYRLLDEINSMEIVESAKNSSPKPAANPPITEKVFRKRSPAPYGASATEEERLAYKRAKQREYTKRYMQRLKELGVKRMSELEK